MDELGPGLLLVQSINSHVTARPPLHAPAHTHYHTTDIDAFTCWLRATLRPAAPVMPLVMQPAVLMPLPCVAAIPRRAT